MTARPAGEAQRIFESGRQEQQAACPDCGGSGEVELGRYTVTHEMAMDAQDLSLEGADYGPAIGKCSTCSGDGWILVEHPPEGAAPEPNGDPDAF